MPRYRRRYLYPDNDTPRLDIGGWFGCVLVLTILMILIEV